MVSRRYFDARRMMLRRYFDARRMVSRRYFDAKRMMLRRYFDARPVQHNIRKLELQSSTIFEQVMKPVNVIKMWDEQGRRVVSLADAFSTDWRGDNRNLWKTIQDSVDVIKLGGNEGMDDRRTGKGRESAGMMPLANVSSSHKEKVGLLSRTKRKTCIPQRRLE